MRLARTAIRTAKPQDSAALSAIVYRSKQSNGDNPVMMAKFADNGALKITPERLAQHPFWVAEQEDTVVGCIALDPRDGRSGELRTLFVAPELTGQGIGRLLWFHLLPVAQTQGFKELTVTADPAAVPFYETLGFVTRHMIESSAIAGRMIPFMSMRL